VPYGALSLRLDALAAVFLMPVGVVGASCALHGAAVGRGEAPPSWTSLAAFDLLLASMALITVASNLVLFLVAWEAMTLFSYALVVTDHDSRAVRGAGFLYLVAAHLATAALLILFVTLAAASGSWGMTPGNAAWHAPGWLFLLALVGFGTKAGVAPFHVWLPDAHASAPGHVSALMSGVMVTLGFYGLARFLPMLGPATPAQGYALLALGGAGALGGILLALVQRDVKRILAYSTVENAGLVTLALGVGRLGQAFGRMDVAVLGWTAALLHIWNHALFKSLLFQGIGALAHAVHDRDLERWGGLMRRAPLIGVLVVVGAGAIGGLPGLNGFVGEWLIFRAMFAGGLALHGGARVAMVVGIAGLALTAALALACYGRLVGVGLLGMPRSAAAERMGAPSRLQVAPMAFLAMLCAVGAWLPVLLVAALRPAVAGLVPDADAGFAAGLVAPLVGVALLVAVTIGAIVGLRRALDIGRTVRRAMTWDCGYAHPDPRMQYTASSVSELSARMFSPLLRPRVERRGLDDPWPASAAWSSRTSDRTVTEVYRPALAHLTGLMERLRNLQEPRVTTYLRYVVLALLAVLASLFLPTGAWP
jgi:formate hydrogenlyase subunit 3/multisubunit Na+/H+ antiporter MnhD subunit